MTGFPKKVLKAFMGVQKKKKKKKAFSKRKKHFDSVK